MTPARSFAFFTPLARSLAQLDDPIFLGVVARSVAWSLACFATLNGLTIWVVHDFAGLHGPLAWSVDILSSIGALLLALWLFLPVAAVIGTFYLSKVASAVERRFYPHLQSARGAPAVDQIWDGIVLGLRILMLNALALILAVVVPPIGPLLGWMIAAFAVGRGLFVAVAMRRMPRATAEALYRSRRGLVLTQGAILCLAAYVPVLNLLIPVIGAAAMVHILDSVIEDDFVGGASAGGWTGSPMLMRIDVDKPQPNVCASHSVW